MAPDGKSMSGETSAAGGGRGGRLEDSEAAGVGGAAAEAMEDGVNVVARFAAGEEGAFTTLFDHYRQRLYYFALRFVTEADAQDIVSEAFIGLWQKRADFVHPAAVQHYLFVAVRNRCLKLLRHELVKMHHQDEMLHRLETMGEEQLDLERLTGELVKHIYAEVAQLPPRLREVFLLSFRDGLKPADIAARLQLSVQTVSNQKLSAIRLLRQALGDRAHLLSLLVLLCLER